MGSVLLLQGLVLLLSKSTFLSGISQILSCSKLWLFPEQKFTVLSSAGAAEPSRDGPRAGKKSCLKEFSPEKNPFQLQDGIVHHHCPTRMDLCPKFGFWELLDPPLSSPCAVFLQKCLLSGLWLLSRRYPIPALPRSALDRISSSALAPPQVGPTSFYSIYSIIYSIYSIIYSIYSIPRMFCQQSPELGVWERLEIPIFSVELKEFWGS